MDYKKLAAVFSMQGKKALAKKVYREKSKPKTITFSLCDGSIIHTVREKSIIKILSPGFTLRNTYLHYRTFRFFCLDYHDVFGNSLNKNINLNNTWENCLILCYSCGNPGKHKSDGIIKSKITRIDEDLRERIYERTEIPNLDLEFSANANLLLSFIVGEDTYQGRYDKCIDLMKFGSEIDIKIM